MIITKLIPTMFNTFPYPCVVIDVPADVWSGEIMNMLFEVMDIGLVDSLAGIEISAVATTDLEFAVSVADLVTDSIIGCLPGNDVDVLADVNANRSPAAMTALEFVIPGPLEA